MSKASLLIAAASASAGAAVAALFMRSSGQRTIVPTPSSTSFSPGPAISPSQVSSAPTQKILQDARSPVDPSGWFAYGAPGPVNDLARRTAFMSSYDRRTRNPAWVAEHITPESLATSDGDRRHSTFLEDPAVPEKFRAKLSDYFKSGYDRGHQVPAADAKFSQTAMNETFYLTNMCPQVGDGFNRDYWSHFEDFCRRLTKRYPSVRIVTGPLYLPKLEADGKYRVSYEVIGSPPSVAVPTHFYKVIVAESALGSTGLLALGAFVLPNAPISNKTPLTEFAVPVEIIERASGLDFTSRLPNDRRKALCKEVECSIVVRDFSKKAAQTAKR